MQQPSIQSWVNSAAINLEAAGIETAKLDAELLLAYTLRRDRTYLHAHADDPLADRHLEAANARLQARIERTPLAYITGVKEFYGRSFRVTPAVLIPRPESEDIITILKQIYDTTYSNQLPLEPIVVVDVGTGSGCLGITAKLEIENASVTLIDNSKYALAIAEENAHLLHADVQLLCSSLLNAAPSNIDVIMANLPYVDTTWDRSKETNYEPKEALFAEDGGLALIKRLIYQAPMSLTTGGHVLIEADPEQHDALIMYAKERGLQHVGTLGYIMHFAYSPT